MAVHSLHIFDRRGKTLFTKCYLPKHPNNKNEYGAATTDASGEEGGEEESPELMLSEQRKLVFGMVFSLRELASNLSPSAGDALDVLHTVQTGASTLYHYETVSGMRLALYTTPDKNSLAGHNSPEPGSTHGNSAHGGVGTPNAIRMALRHVYEQLWVPHVVRSPLYQPTKPSDHLASTKFESLLDAYLQSTTWFR